MKSYLAIAAVLLWAPSATLFAAATEGPPDWWTAQNAVGQSLMKPKADITRLVSELKESEARSGQAVMYRLYLFMHAGLEKEAVRTLGELKARCPDLHNHQVAAVYYTACDEFEAWDLARKVVEVYADNLSEVALWSRLLRHMEDAGWPFDRVDAWLADKPEGIESFWIKERLAFQARHRREQPLVNELAEGVRRDPDNAEPAIAFLGALDYARPYTAAPRDLAWVAQTVHPGTATHAEKIATLLERLGNPEAASVFFRQAMDTPLTRDEEAEMAMMRQAAASPGHLRAGFAIHARERLAECLLELGRSEEAQQEMEMAQTLRAEHHMARNAWLAGQVQAASGRRVVETLITGEEPERQEDPEYWMERAAYYRGRQETQREEEALKKGLALTEARPAPERRGKGYIDPRARILSQYALFLKRVERSEEAVALLRSELRQAPAASESAKAAARLLGYDFPGYLGIDDELLWTWLAGRPRWEHVEERLLWRMLEGAPRDGLDSSFIRAETLAQEQDPSRSFTLGWIMNRMGFPGRSIPQLERALASASSEEDGQRAAFALFESYLDTGSWRDAEKIFPEAGKRLTAKEVGAWHGRIAMTAAEAGSKADALRIWSELARTAPMETGALETLARSGLRSDLIKLYQAMARELPASSAPANALRVLNREPSSTPDT